MNEYDFSIEFPTYILGFCPNTGGWFATNQRFVFYEYPMVFPNEKTVIEFFKKNLEAFYNLKKEMAYTALLFIMMAFSWKTQKSL